MTSPTLDIENFPALLGYLRAGGHIHEGESPKFTNLAGGVSNRTVLLERESGEAWVLKQALAKLRVAVDWESDPRRIEREALGMRRLAELAPAGTITPLIFLDPDVHLLAMQAVPRPHENWKTMLLAGQLQTDHISQFATLLATIHRLSFARRATLAVEFEDRSFFESLRVEPYYLYTAENVPAAAGFLHRLVDLTRATRYSLVHGDFSPKNILVYHNRLILLDHEVIHFGDGAFDLGFSLTHLLSKAHHLRAMRAAFAIAAKAYWTRYLKEIGDLPWSDGFALRVVAHTLGCLLARCAGRSPLEYLDAEARRLQAKAVVDLMNGPPIDRVEDLIDGFIAGL